eukprot:240155-Amphidinium_carterae.1
MRRFGSNFGTPMRQATGRGSVKEVNSPTSTSKRGASQSSRQSRLPWCCQACLQPLVAALPRSNSGEHT